MIGSKSRQMVRGNRGFVTVGVAVAVLVGSLALAFGAPEHSRLLSLLSGHGWLTTSQSGQVLLANGQTGQLDFRLDVGSTTGGQLDVVQSGQQALLVDQKTGDAGSIDVGNLKVVKEPDVHGTVSASFRTALGTATDASAATQVLPGPQGDFYIVHRQSGRIDVSDPVSDKTVGTAKVGSGLCPAVVAGNGSLWVERQQTGTMTGADYEHGSIQMQQVKNSVVAPGDDVLLSSVNGTPAVLDRSRGLFFLAPNGVPGAAASLPRTVARQAVVAPELSGSVVPLAAPGKVILVQNGTATIRTLNGLAGDQLGAPIAFAQRIYVPDLTDGSVIVLNDSGLQVGAPIQVARGNAPLTVGIQNGTLFINDPDSGKAFSVTSTGLVNSINKDNPNVPTTHTTPTDTPTVTAPAVVPTPATVIPGSAPSGPVHPTTPSSPVSPVTPTTTPTVPASVPAAPGSPTAQAGNKSATVSWTPAATHGSPITGYTVTWSAGGGGSKTLAADKTSAQVTGLTNGTSYTFSIKAHNAIGTGPAAQTTSVTPTSTVPTAPTNVHAVASGDGSVAVSWNAAASEGLKIVGYTVTPSVSSISPITTTPTTTTASFSPADGLEPQTSYTFKVATIAIVATSKVASSEALSNTVTTTAATPTGVSIQVNRTGPHQVTVVVDGDTLGQTTTLSLSGAVNDSASNLAPTTGVLAIFTKPYTLSWGTVGVVVAKLCAESACATASSPQVNVSVPTLTARFNYQSGCETNRTAPPATPSRPAFHGYVGSYSFTINSFGLPATYVSDERASLHYTRTTGTTSTPTTQPWAYSSTTSTYTNSHGGFWHEGYVNHYTVSFNVAQYGTISATVTTAFAAC